MSVSSHDQQDVSTGQRGDGSYYAKNGAVRQSSLHTRNENGSTTMTLDFAVCHMTDVVGDEAAETVAALMNAGKSALANHPLKVGEREGWKGIDANVIASARDLDEAQRAQPEWLWFANDGTEGIPVARYSFGRWAKIAGQAPYVRADIALAAAPSPTEATPSEGARLGYGTRDQVADRIMRAFPDLSREDALCSAETAFPECLREPARPVGEDALREALTGWYGETEAVCRMLDGDLPDSAPVYVEGRRKSRYQMGTYGDLRRAALASPTQQAPDQGGVERDLSHEKIRRLNETVKRLQTALHESGKDRVYADGAIAAAEVAESVRQHADWGPEATPNDGMSLGANGVKIAVRRFADKMMSVATSPATPKANTGEA